MTRKPRDARGWAHSCAAARVSAGSASRRGRDRLQRTRTCRQQSKTPAPPANERTKEAVSEGITDVFGNGGANPDECSFEELLAKCRQHKRNLTVAAFSAALEYYEAQNRVMHRGGVVHGL